MDLLLCVFLNDVLIFYESDDVMWLIIDSYDVVVFVLVVVMMVGDLCDWLLLFVVNVVLFVVFVLGLMLEMVVVVSKLMCN